jgi:hypothetical protein
LNTLEDAVGRIETALAGLGEALRRRDALAVDTEVQALQGAIASAMHRLSAAARQPGGVPLPLRRRLAVAGGQVAAQRETLARANASLQRALDVLLPPQDALAYAADGARARPASSGAVGA